MGPMATIHPTAIVDPAAQLHDSVDVGPHCVVTGPVTLGENVRLVGHVYVTGPTTIGAGTTVYPFTTIGFPPQDFKFGLGDATAGVLIGENCTLREQAIVHASTDETVPTTLGDNVWLMAATNIGHDCIVGNNVILVGYSGCAGHVILEDNVTIGGQAGVHQHCRLGRLSFMSGGTNVSTDVPPFCTVNERNRIGGINLVGMRRAGIKREDITATRRAFADIFAPCLPRDEMLAALAERADGCAPIAELHAFVESAKRPICPGAGRPPRMFAAFLRHQRRGEAVSIDTAAGDL